MPLPQPVRSGSVDFAGVRPQGTATVAPGPAWSGTRPAVSTTELAFRVTLVGLTCYGGGLLSRLAHLPDVGSAFLYLPYGILTAALLFSPTRHWPAYIGAGFVAHQLAGLGYWPPLRVALVDIG